MKSKHKRQLPTWDGPKVLVLHEHHGKYYMDATTEASFEKSVLRILQGRLSQEDMFIFGDEERELAMRAVSSKHAKAAWSILQSRFDISDEKIDLIKLETHYLTDENDE